MPLFEGHKDSGIERLFIDMPDQAKGEVVWKYPDSQIMQHSIVNVDLDYAAVFTNLGKVIGTLGPGRYPLGEGASLALGWLVDRLTGNSYYDAELYYIATRDIADVDFGGPVDNVSDQQTGLVVSLRVFGNLAFRVTDATALLAKLVGTSGVVDHNGQVIEWVKDQVLAAIRAVLPGLVAQHGVLYMGAIQDATGQAALAKVNEALAAYGLAVTSFAQVNVNLPDDDAAKVKQLAEAKAFTNVAGSYGEYARGQAMLDIAQGVEAGHVDAQPGMMVGMMMGANPGGAPGMVVPGTVSGMVPGAAPGGMPVAPAAPAVTGARFCSNCGAALTPGARFCANCGTAVGAVGVGGAIPATPGPPAAPAPVRAPPPPPMPAPAPVIAAPAPPATAPAEPAGDVPPGPGYWMASDGNWYPPEEQPGR
jgi:membrane protease subunit (stomatin/prohibitin family)